MEITEPNASEEIFTTSGWPYKVCFYVANLISIFLVVISFLSYWGAGLFSLAAAVIFFYIAPFAWNIGNWFRTFIQPDTYFTFGNRDAFNKKIFWMVGPQWAAFSGTFLFVVVVTNLVVLDAANKGPTKMEVEMAAKALPAELVQQISLTTLPPEAAGVKTDAAPQTIAADVSHATTPGLPAQEAPPSQNAVPAPTAVAPTTTSVQNAIPTGFMVLAPDESKQLLTAMIQQATSAFKVSELKGRIEALVKPTTGDRKTARKLNEQGLAALKNDDFALAINSLKSAIATDPADVEVLNNYVFALIKANRLQDAEVEAGRLLTISPGRSSAWANLAEVYAKKKQNEEAIAALILAFQFSSNKDRTVTFLNERAGDNNSPMQVAAKKAIEIIQKM